MPREIKFRAWSHKDRDMLSWLLIRQSAFNREHCHLMYDVFTRPAFDDAGYTLMQFTGNTDKAKKEIYESDIMKIQLPVGGFWGNTPTEKIGVVRYEAECGGFIVEWEYSKNQHHIILTCDIAHTGEVIGNTFQNPTLIKHS